MTDEPAFDEEIEVISSDAPPLFTMVPEWITYSELKPAQREFWTVLASCVNHGQSHNRVWPAGPELADAMRISNPDQLKAYREALQALGAIVIEERRYANGMRRRYLYDVRFHPPSGYTGPRSRTEWLARRKERLAAAAAAAESADTAAFEADNSNETPGQTGTSKNRGAGAFKNRGAGTPENGGAGAPENRGAKPDQQKPDQEKPHAALAARSAGDGRRPSTGSSGAGSRSATSSATAHSRERDPRKSPVRQVRMTREQASAVRTIEARYPAELAARMPAYRPAALRNAILATLGDAPRQRSAEQLADRLERRWYSWGYAEKNRRGEISSYPGVAIALLTRHVCGHDRCEDGTDIDGGGPCRTCPDREQLRRDRSKAPPLPRQRSHDAGPAPARWECSAPECRAPGRGAAPADGLCASCRSQAKDAAQAVRRLAADLSAWEERGGGPLPAAGP